jgi:SNF2 family DNA or RNA helicase
VGEHGWKLFDYLKKYPHELTGEDLLLKRISKNTIRYSREECVDLPEKIYEHRFVHPTPEQSTILNGLSSDMNFELKDGIEIQSHAQKLLQVTSGFLMKEGEVVWEAEKNPKAVELESIIKQMEGKFIIYHIYVHESEIIQSILDKHKIEHVVLNGKVPKNVRDKRLGLFQSNDNCRVMVAHPETGGVGLNLQFCNTIIYYSNGYIGHILREQSEGRTNRTGQTRNCVYIDLIMRGTLDEVLYESLMNKGDSIRATLNFIKNIHSKKT